LSAVRGAVFGSRHGQPKTLIDRFHYPDRGPGQMWEAVAARVQQQGAQLRLERPIVRICHSDRRVTHVVARHGDAEERYAGSHFISSMPMRELIDALEPAATAEVRAAAASLRYRDFLTVSLVVNRAQVVPDNWIYIHDPKVRVGRIQNFKNWSPAMVPDANKTCLGLEYFVFENDELWRMSDADLLKLAAGELVALGLARAQEIEDGTVVRVHKAYPMYDPGWTERIKVIRSYLEQELANLQLVGRNGMHKYNNQDHSMMTAIGAARNILGARIDVWAINTEPEYQEEIAKAEEERRPAYAEPKRVKRPGKAAEAAGEAR
jgi:protoporphyrinogen oxidase